MELKARTLVFLWMMGSFALVCVAHYTKDKQKQLDKSITCYECNSEFDPRCADPFDPYTIGTVNCSMKKPLEHRKDLKPILCRKTVQKVFDHKRVIRGCGYIADRHDDKECFLRTGTHDVEVTYCSCTKSLCNTGPITRNLPPTPIIISSTIMAALTSALRMA